MIEMYQIISKYYKNKNKWRNYIYKFMGEGGGLL